MSAANAAPASTFNARDGATRLYRLYQGSGADVLVLLHGSGSDSRYLAGLARALSAQSALTVVTLDMRGHGPEPGHRGDVDRVDQQEQDIADLLAHLKGQSPFGRFLLAGHSIGGGLAIRYAAGREQPKPDGLVLLAPYIHRNSASARPDSGGWATPFVTRFAGIDMLQRIGVHAFDGLQVLRFEMPAKAKDGMETPVYTWRMFTSVTPRADWRSDIARIACPVLVLAAEHDSIFRSEGYPDVFGPLSRATVEIIPAIDHFQLAVSDHVPRRIGIWLSRKS
jgi:alpha-beta hydrolase superfamily lysophospholipase